MPYCPEFTLQPFYNDTKINDYYTKIREISSSTEEKKYTNVSTDIYFSYPNHSDH
jgi:hypothetical protein